MHTNADFKQPDFCTGTSRRRVSVPAGEPPTRLALSLIEGVQDETKIGPRPEEKHGGHGGDHCLRSTSIRGGTREKKKNQRKSTVSLHARSS